MAANYRRPLSKAKRSTASSYDSSPLDDLHYSCFCNIMQALLLYILKEPDRILLSGSFAAFSPFPPSLLYSVQGFIVQWRIELRAAPPRYHITGPQQGMRSPVMRLPLYSFYPFTAAPWSSWPLGWHRPLGEAGQTSDPPASGSPVQIWCLKS